MNSGQRFLQVTRGRGFQYFMARVESNRTVRGAAHQRGGGPTGCSAGGKQLTAGGGSLRLGYRPRVLRGAAAWGEQSWYFRFLLDGREFIAVIGEGWETGRVCLGHHLRPEPPGRTTTVPPRFSS